MVWRAAPGATVHRARTTRHYIQCSLSIASPQGASFVHMRTPTIPCASPFHPPMCAHTHTFARMQSQFSNGIPLTSTGQTINTEELKRARCVPYDVQPPPSQNSLHFVPSSWRKVCTTQHFLTVQIACTLRMVRFGAS